MKASPWPRKSLRRTMVTAMIMASSETRCKCRQCRQCRRSHTFKLEGKGYGAFPHIAPEPPLAAVRGAPHIRGRTAPTPSTGPTLGPTTASFSPTQRDRWSGGQRPLQRPISARSHPRLVGLWRLSVCKTISVTTSTLSTTSEVVWGSTTLCHRAKLCADSLCVFLGLFSFEEGAHG